jgi:hypothetical protein
MMDVHNNVGIIEKKEIGDEHPYYFCSIYDGRPQQCRDHTFEWSRFCPIGLDVLKPDSMDYLRERIDHGWELVTGRNRFDEIG